MAVKKKKKKTNRHWICETYNWFDTYMNYNDRSYSVADIVKKSEEYEVQTAPIDAFEMHYSSLCDANLPDFCHHMARVLDADISYPIILSPMGCILDGRHRLCKHIMLGKKEVKFIRLREMPTNSYPKKEDENKKSAS